jgi:hypothetical protein
MLGLSPAWNCHGVSHVLCGLTASSVIGPLQCGAVQLNLREKYAIRQAQDEYHAGYRKLAAFDFKGQTNYTANMTEISV